MMMINSVSFYLSNIIFIYHVSMMMEKKQSECGFISTASVLYVVD